MGVSGWERFVVHNLTKNPDAAEAYLKKIGYQVKRYGNGWDIAVRREPGEMWKPVDPEGLDAQDFFDFIGELAVGAAQTAGAVKGALLGAPTVVGAIPGAVAGGAVGGALGEAGREALGSLAGVPDNIGGAEIATSGAVGAAFPAAGAALKPVLKGAGNVALSTVAKVAGVQGTAAMPASEALKRVASQKLGSLTDRSAAAKVFVTMVRNATTSNIKQAQKANGLLDTLPNARVDWSDIEDGLIRHTLRQPGKPAFGVKAMSGAAPGKAPEEALRAAREAALPNNVDAVMERISGMMGNHTWDDMPVALANQVKQVLQEESKFTLASPAGKQFRNLMRTTSRDMRLRLEKAVTAAGHPEYVRDMRLAHTGIKYVEQFKKAITTPEKAEAFITSTMGNSPSARRKAVKSFGRFFGVDPLDAMRQSQAREAVGVGGRGSLAPRSLFGIGLPMGAAYAAGAGQPLLAGALLVGSSPRVQVALARSAVLAGQIPALGVGPATAGSASSVLSRMLAVEAANMKQREGVRQDGPKKKPKVILGGY